MDYLDLLNPKGGLLSSVRYYILNLNERKLAVNAIQRFCEKELLALKCDDRYSHLGKTWMKKKSKELNLNFS